MKKRTLFSPDKLILLATLLGVICGFYPVNLTLEFAGVISHVFINLLKMISLPLIFLSIVATISGMKSLEEMKVLGKKVLFYTFITTIIATIIALFIFKIINPVVARMEVIGDSLVPKVAQSSYIDFLLKIVPSNVLQTLSDNTNVIGVVFIALIFSFAILTLDQENKDTLNKFFSSFLAAILNIARYVVLLMPLGVWAFITLFVSNVCTGLANIKSLMLYVVCVLLAYFIQGLVILPLFLWYKGISPFKAMRAMSPALTIAFFTKSSSAALPMSLECAQERLGVSKRVAQFTLTLCSVINMNASAAFILITVLFVATNCGVSFTVPELILWLFISTLTAIGTAGVPMGSFFLSSALLAGMNVPLALMGIILPINAIIDMFGTTLNVWSDAVITTITDKDLF